MAEATAQAGPAGNQDAGTATTEPRPSDRPVVVLTTPVVERSPMTGCE